MKRKEEIDSALESRLEATLERFREGFRRLVEKFDADLKSQRLLSALTDDLRWAVAETRLPSATYILNRIPADHAELLTPRQRELAELLVRRLGRREIAGILAISPRTLDTQVDRLCVKYGAGSKADLVRRLGPLG